MTQLSVLQHSSCIMKFSLVVPTIGRDRELRLLLASLVVQTRQNFEVIVVDQSQGDAIAVVVDEFRDRLSITHFRMSQRGLTRARNFGWERARGEILNFPDDDCTWPPNLLAEVEARLDARPALDALVTRVEKMSRTDAKGGLVNRDNIFRRCVEFAVFFRRARMGDLRYDEQIGLNQGTPWAADEGPDLMLRMIDRRMSIEYFPELCIYHPDPLKLSPRKLWARTLGYSRGRGYVLRKHGYSLLTVGHTLVRSLGGAILMFSCGRWTMAGMYWLSFWGKCVGYLEGERATNQAVHSPIASDSSDR